jgi:nucleoside 2-deoxyribosyltransferase
MYTIKPLENIRRVYCAGPLFSEVERQQMMHLAEVLAGGGFEPFVPHADGMEFAQLHPYLIAQGHDATLAGQWVHEAVFALDIYQVVCGCGSLVFNLNGRVPDEGAVSEAAIAWTLGKPIVIYKDDIRTAVAGRDNPLVVGLANFERIDSVEKVPDVLERKIATHPCPQQWRVPCPPHLEGVIRAGERFWAQLESFGIERPVAPLAELVLELFGPQRVLAQSEG